MTPPTPPSPTPLTEEHTHAEPIPPCPACEAAAIARHVRETGCEAKVAALNDALATAIGSLVAGTDGHQVRTATELSRVMDDTNEMARAYGDDKERDYLRGRARDWLTRNLATPTPAAPPSPEATCARCGCDESRHRAAPEPEGWCSECLSACPGYLAASPATEGA